MGNNIKMDIVPKKIVAFTANYETCYAYVNGNIK